MSKSEEYILKISRMDEPALKKEWGKQRKQMKVKRNTKSWLVPKERTDAVSAELRKRGYVGPTGFGSQADPNKVWVHKNAMTWGQLAVAIEKMRPAQKNKPVLIFGTPNVKLDLLGSLRFVVSYKWSRSHQDRTDK